MIQIDIHKHVVRIAVFPFVWIWYVLVLTLHLLMLEGNSPRFLFIFLSFFSCHLKSSFMVARDLDPKQLIDGVVPVVT